ncbi:MAG TPA: hypothetical protein VN700_01410 [Vicinamibacterales bacterium]|nr:hypothetical protein [Vicinamibacterales bacterium]
MTTAIKKVAFWSVTGLGLLLALGATAGARQSSDEKQILVTVMNLKTGNPIPGVTAANLGIKEDGKDREIVKVEPASGPVSVVLLADTTDTMKIYQNELKATAKGFIAAMMAKVPGSSISLWQFGGAGVPVTQFLTDAAALTEEAGKLRPRDVVSGVSAAGSNLLEGVVDGAKALGKRTETRRAIVSFNTLTASEGSKVQKSNVVSELQKNGVAWYGVSFADGGTASGMRDSLMSEVMPMSGGIRLNVSDVARIEGAVKALADIIGSQYLVTYKRSGSAKEVAVEVKAEGARAFHARWAPK